MRFQGEPPHGVEIREGGPESTYTRSRAGSHPRPPVRGAASHLAHASVM